MTVSHKTEPTFDYTAGNNTGIRIRSVFNVDWKPVKGKLYRQVDPLLELCMLPMDPHTTVFRTSFGNKTTVVENGRRALHIKDEPVVLYLGERQRIPDHYTFFKVLWQERPWWIYYQEVVFSYCFGRPAVYPPDYNYPTQLG